MNFVYVLVTSVVSGLVSAFTVLSVVLPVQFPDVDLLPKTADDIKLVERIEPYRCDVPESCHIFKRGTPYKIKGTKIKEGQMLVQVESMDINIEPLNILSRQHLLLRLKKGTVFMLVGSGDISSSLVILAPGRDDSVDI